MRVYAAHHVVRRRVDPVLRICLICRQNVMHTTDTGKYRVHMLWQTMEATQ